MVCPNCRNVSDDERICNQCGVLASPLAPTTSASGGAHSPATVSPLLDSGALTGMTLDQKYYLESKLGVGGMGTVYRASRLLIGDCAAVKVLHPDQMSDPQAGERFRREAQTAARLKHPNVVAVYDFCVSSEGLNYQVMELAEGESLRSLVERQGTLAETDAAEIIRQVCAALDEAHRQGVVHRDIKPENILVQTIPSGLHVKVLDFGIAALREVKASRLTRNGAVMGTPHYMSPEHCLGEELDGRSDIYSLGIVLFEMLTGVVPFDSSTPTAIVVKHVNDPPPRPRTLNPKITPAVEAVTLRALEKRRDARPQTASELARELIAAAGSAGPISPRPALSAVPVGIAPERITAPALLDDAPAFGDVSAKTGSSRRLLLPIFAVLLLLAGGGGLLWYMLNGGDEQTAATNASASSSQQTVPDLNATAGPSTSPAPPASGNNVWEVTSDLTSGVADAANALGPANQQMAVIHSGGQIA